MPSIITEFHDGDLGKKYRIIAIYKNTCRPMFWFKVSRDASIYCGPYRNSSNIREIYTGSSIKDKNGVLTFNLDNIRQNGNYINPNETHGMKVSFHGSGIIHSIDGSRVFRAPIRNLTSQEELFITMFSHPDTFDEMTPPRPYDIPLRINLEDAYPLALQVSISKPENTVLGCFPSDKKDSINMIFQYHGVETVGNLNLQFSFGMPSEGPWPDLTLMTFPVQPD